MSSIGNFFWFFSLGWLGALLWATMALLFCWTPYAVSFLQMAKLYLAPFGKDIVSLQDIARAKKFLKGAADDEAADETADQAWVRTAGAYLKVPPTELAIWAKRLGMLFNVLWIPFGLILASIALAHAFFLAVTVVGIPFVPASLRIARLSVWPIGQRVVDKRYGDLIRDALYNQSLRA